MKALSIRQPWAWAILRAGKRHENRSWQTSYRGPLLIHASAYRPKQADVDSFNAAFNIATPSKEDRYAICGRFCEALSFDRGGIIGIVDVIDCVSESDSPWFFGPHALVFANPRPVEFVPFKGRLGFFDVPDNLIKVLS